MSDEQKVGNVLVGLVVKNEGDWKKTLIDINDKNRVDDAVVEESIRLNRDFITIIDEDYPHNLKYTFQPPFALFYKGNKELLNSNNLLAILNDFNASKYAVDSINTICDSIVSQMTFVIPLVRKNDVALAERLVNKGAKVIAVLNKGLGIDIQDMKELYEELTTNHIVITSIPIKIDGTTNESLIQCYTLLAGIASKVLVGAIGKASPHNITIASAIHASKDVYCIPFPVGSKYITNSLIREGACLVETGDDIVLDKKLKENKG